MSLRVLWLHIGTPKSGTTALQRYVMGEARAGLAEAGLTYITPKNFGAANKLAIALNKGRADEIAAFQADLAAQCLACTTPQALISSEMFYGIRPARIFQHFPQWREIEVKVLVYLRRQDLYLESGYLQKVKNGRFFGSINDYLTRFSGSGANYWETLQPWMAQDGLNIELVPRICERPRLVGGDVISDMAALMGLPEPAPEALARQQNVSPGITRLQLLSLASSIEGFHPRRIQRRLNHDFPDQQDAKAVMFTPKERQSLMQSFAAGNEALRQRFFPNAPTLFDMASVAAPPEPDDPPFTQAQLKEIKALLSTLQALYVRHGESAEGEA